MSLSMISREYFSASVQEDDLGFFNNVVIENDLSAVGGFRERHRKVRDHVRVASERCESCCISRIGNRIGTGSLLLADSDDFSVAAVSKRSKFNF